MKGTFLSIVAALIAGIACPAHAQKKPDPALELYFAANAAYNRKLYPIAAGNFQKFLGQFPAHEKAQLARYGLGLSQFRLKQYDRAVNEFLTLKKAPKLDAKIERGRVTLLHAQCLLYSGKADDALIHLTAASANLPAGIHRTGAKAAVADIYFRKNDWAKTITWTQRMQQDKPTAAQSIATMASTAAIVRARSRAASVIATIFSGAATYTTTCAAPRMPGSSRRVARRLMSR